MFMLKKLIWLIIILVLAYGFFILIFTPIKKQISKRFISRGETYLSARDYSQAAKEFNKALKFNRNNQKIIDYIELTQKTKKDLSKGLSFFKKHNTELAKKIQKAQGNFPHAKAALELAINYLESGDKQLALVAVNRYLEMEPNYPDAKKIKNYKTKIET